MLHYFRLTVALIIGLTASAIVSADGLEVQKVTKDVYAIVGEIGQRSPENLGNNATYGFVITTEGIVLIDAGGSYKGAQLIHQAIQRITDKPIVMVINTGGQDQRWLGNDYFKQQGAKIIASEATVKDQKARVSSQLSSLDRLVGKKGMEGTRDVYADQVFPEKIEMTVGGVRFQLHNPGQAHTPGDTYVWLPESKVVFTGDIVYIDRILSVSSVSKSSSWLKAFEFIAALQPTYLVPGHGHVTDLKRARADTYDYLTALRQGVAELIEQGMGLESVSKIDQSRFQYLKFFDELKGPNAHQTFQEMEWE